MTGRTRLQVVLFSLVALGCGAPSGSRIAETPPNVRIVKKEQGDCCEQKRRLIEKILEQKGDCDRQFAKHEICMRDSEKAAKAIRTSTYVLAVFAKSLSKWYESDNLPPSCPWCNYANDAAAAKCPLPACVEHLDKTLEQIVEGVGYRSGPDCTCEPLSDEELNRWIQ